PRATHRPTEARRRDGRARRRLPQRCALPARARAEGRRRRAPGVHADDPGARHARYRRVARRAAGEDGVLERLQGARRVVEPDAPVLSRGALPRLRVAAFVILAAAVVAWDAVAPHLEQVALWPTVAIIAVGVLPATLGLIYLALPLWSHRRVVLIGVVALGVTAIVTWEANAHLASNFAKLGAYTCAGWAFLWLFEELGWVVIVAAIIPFVGALSVAAGPTQDIVNHHAAG